MTDSRPGVLKSGSHLEFDLNALEGLPFRQLLSVRGDGCDVVRRSIAKLVGGQALRLVQRVFRIYRKFRTQQLAHSTYVFEVIGDDSNANEVRDGVQRVVLVNPAFP